MVLCYYIFEVSMNNITNCINNFKAYDNKSALSIIKNLGSEEVLDKNDKRLFVIAGPNGSGKTSQNMSIYIKYLICLIFFIFFYLLVSLH